jgi:hypothetical protein
MGSRRRSSVVVGLMLILLGVLLAVVRLVPGLQSWTDIECSWPLIIVGVGALLLVAGLLTSVPALAVPSCIVGGIGGLLYWQNATDAWESWAYVWTLIPGFVGAGILLSSLLGGEGHRAMGEGVKLILVSLAMFTIFGSFFGSVGLMGKYWPVLLIALGLLILLQRLFRS